ncbi:DUF1566 domain-containing protein [Patescibacteria group bacterium]|nr:DUF1566 domain-containing protein [Patescibacteria group bacterium]
MKKKRINYFKYFSLFFAIAVLVFIAGCTGAPPTAPIINSFSASPSTITIGESSTLSWSVTDATSVTIDNGIGSVALTGTTGVNPTTTTTYTLTATNSTGSVTATTTVTVSSAVTVTYNGNGNTAGTVPVDPSSPYEYGATVTVLGNTGDLTRINDGGTSYRFTGWNTKADGSGAYQAEGSTFTIGASNVTLYAQWTPYVLRDTGPAGGYIFYDKGYYSYGWRYLEAAPSDQSASTEWGCYGVSISGADGTAVGTGEQNTIDIEAGCTAFGTAADICANLGLGGYSDWFLPSKDELNLMYENLKVFGVGGFAEYNYWSSSEDGAYLAWLQDFYNGNQGSYYKFNTLRVRAIRAF